MTDDGMIDPLQTADGKEATGKGGEERDEQDVLASVQPTAVDERDANSSIRPTEVDEKDMPIEEARCWMVNGTERDVDIYVNYADKPLISDIQAKSIGPMLTLDGTVDLPYGTYTFEARDKGSPDGDVLASASVTLDEGDSFSAVLHRVGEYDYQMSVYRNDYSPSQDARVVVRHCAYPEEIDWELTDNGETPRIPDDPRSGTLRRGQWQEATDVTEQDYLFEALVNDQVAAFDVNYEFEVATTYVVYVVGDPEPLYLPDDPPYEESRDGGIDESQWLLVQAFEVYPGDDEEDAVTPPTAPASITDDNQHVEFDCDPIELYETNVTEVEIAASDPDGVVTGLAIADVEPPTDGFTVVDNSIDRGYLPGESTTATLRVAADLPPDDYDVTIEANPGSLGESATCTVPVRVEPIPVARLYDLVDEYQLSEDIDQSIATESNVLLDDAATHLDAGETTEACTALKEFLDLLGANKGKGVSQTALDDIQPETKALRKRLDCG